MPSSDGKSSTKKISLTSSDGKSFELTWKILAKVMEYCKKHLETPKAEGGAADDELKNWDAEFVEVDGSTLFDLIMEHKYDVPDCEIGIFLEARGEAIEVAG